MVGLPVFWGRARGKVKQTLGDSLSLWFQVANLKQPSAGENCWRAVGLNPTGRGMVSIRCPDYADDIQLDTML